MNFRFRQNMLGQQVLQIEEFVQSSSWCRFTNEERQWMTPKWRDATRWEADDYRRMAGYAISHLRDCPTAK